MTNNDSTHIEYGGGGAALEFALWSLDEQLQAIKDIDAKAERALTLAVAILALFSGASTLGWGAATDQLRLAAIAAVVIAFFVVAVVLFFRCQEAANLHLGPDGRRLLAVSTEHGELRVRQWLAEHVYRSIESNRRLIYTKNRHYLYLAYAVMGEAIVASVAIVGIAAA